MKESGLGRHSEIIGTFVRQSRVFAHYWRRCEENGKHGGSHRELEKLFGDVGREMISHMQKEQILFPYIEALERSADGIGSVKPPFFQTVRNPVHAMMKEHDAVGDLVKQIHKASDGYTAPTDGCTSYRFHRGISLALLLLATVILLAEAVDIGNLAN